MTRTWAPNRSYSQPVANAAGASAAMAAAYSTGTVAVANRWRVTRW
ncbi:hypothetical protein Q2K21_19235 [Streptomyces sp. CGMCC 4.7035]|nr:hypothetical protein [Streptomyces sp. CGMCC 4.7035]WNC00031.1 hypothetical protein Q2K21_19235 [Streptomyces sp. CGMCC 4.7035]